MLSCSYSSIRQKQVTEYVHASLSMSSGTNVYLSHPQSCRVMCRTTIRTRGHFDGAKMQCPFVLAMTNTRQVYLHATPTSLYWSVITLQGGAFKNFPNSRLVFLKLNQKTKTETWHNPKLHWAGLTYCICNADLFKYKFNRARFKNQELELGHAFSVSNG